MAKLTEKPTLDWLRLTPLQTRIILAAWSADSIVCKGRELNSAHRLARRNLLEFVQSIDGGLRGEFRLTSDARAYPPTGLKRLLVHKRGRQALSSNRRGE